MTDPQTIIDEIARILRPGGLFWATTPSANSLSFRLMRTDWSVLAPPEHMQLYSKKGICQMLKKAGFKEINIRTLGLNPMEIVQHYRTGPQAKNKLEGSARAQAAYGLNESLMKSPFRRNVKNVLSGILNTAGIGDSLKIFARK